MLDADFYLQKTNIWALVYHVCLVYILHRLYCSSACSVVEVVVVLSRIAALLIMV